MLSDVTQVVLPPLWPAGVQLHFFCSLQGNQAAPELLATMGVWQRLHALTPEQVSVHIACGVRSEDDWYQLATTWLDEERQALATRAQREAALDRAQDLLTKMRPVGQQLLAYLTSHLLGANHGQRPQAPVFH
ncbi:hypothetical protein D3C71_21840 [compost metagenome]